MGETAKQLLPDEILLLNEQLLALNLDVASTDLCNVAYRVTQDNTLYFTPVTIEGLKQGTVTL